MSHETFRPDNTSDRDMGREEGKNAGGISFFSFSCLIFTINSLNENMIMCNYRYNSAEWDECDSHSPT